jgi:predicted DNA-binding protein (MmcQ/YjbR family)
LKSSGTCLVCVLPPYLASRGLKWIQHYGKPGLSARDLKDYLRQSHYLVSRGLPKKKRRELDLG